MVGLLSVIVLALEVRKYRSGRALSEIGKPLRRSSMRTRAQIAMRAYTGFRSLRTLRVEP
jgi:hypothetical protein